MTFEIMIGVLEKIKKSSLESIEEDPYCNREWELGYSAAMNSCIELLEQYKDEILTKTKKTKKTTKGE